MIKSQDKKKAVAVNNLLILPDTVRTAMASYMLRRWNVECIEHHSLKGDEFHLWLKNR